MDRVPLNSSNLASVGYDASSLTLEVEFKDGGVYQYFDVPPSEYEALMQATSSHGKYFISNIRTIYRYARL